MTHAHQGLVPDDAPTGPIRVAGRHAPPPPAQRARRGARWLWVAGVAALLLVAGGAVVALGGASPSVVGLSALGPSDPCTASQTTLSGFGAPLLRSTKQLPAGPGRTCFYADNPTPELMQYAVIIQDYPRNIADDPNSGVLIIEADPTRVGQTVNGIELRQGPNGVLISVMRTGAMAVCQTAGHVWSFNATATSSSVEYRGAGDGVAALVSSVGCERYTRR